jgi:NitT/TauT family transport system substrate-binding protein
MENLKPPEDAACCLCRVQKGTGPMGHLALYGGMLFAYRLGNRNTLRTDRCAALIRQPPQPAVQAGAGRKRTGIMYKSFSAISFGLGAVTAAVLVASAANAQTAIKFSLDFKFEGPSAPFVVAIDKGYFKAEGLDVTIDSASGSIEPITRVASGTYNMGFADINSLIKFRDANPAIPIKAVFMVYNKPPFAVVGRKSRGVSSPKDLEGKKLGAPAPDGAFAQWKIFVQANNIDASKVTIENVGFPVREPMLAAGQVDAITGFSFSSFINLKDRGVPVDDIVVLLMADYGVNLYGNAIIVNPTFAAEKPEAVKGFLRALAKGLQDTVKDPAAAVDSVIKRNDVAKKEVELERLKIALSQNILTPEVKANGFGAVDMGRLDKSIDQIALTYDFKAKPKGADIFDASYLPPAASLKVN